MEATARRAVAMVKGQRWKVLEREGVIAREGPEEYCRILPEALPAGAVVEEQELKGNRLRFLRLSGRGPYTGWVDVRDGSVDLLARVEKKAGAAASAAPAAEDDLDGTSKRKKGSEKWRPPPQVEPAPAQPVNSSYPRPGRFWKVVGAPKSGLTVWQGVAESSPILPGTLPQGAVVEEVQVVGNRLSFTDFSMRGPPSGWVNIRENGRDMIVVDMEGLSTLNIAEALKESAGMSFQMPQPVQAPREEAPLSGWAKLSEMYEKPLAKQRMDLAAAAAETDTAKRRARRRPRASVKEIPPLEELAHASEEMLVDMLGFPEEEAKHFAMMNEESKNRVITECRALIDMSPLERQMAFEKLRKAWPRGPFPSFAKPSENLPSVNTNLLPAGTCFPIKRPPKTSSAPSNLVSALDGKPGTFFVAEPHLNAPEQKKALQALAQKVAVVPAQEVAADPSVAAERMDFCRLPASKVDAEKLAQNVMAKAKLSGADVALYLAEEMRKRPLVMDAGPGPKLKAAGLSEADYRGERAKVLRDSASQLGNVDLLSLSKPNLVLDTHKDYLKAGADICCTNTLNANALAQRDFKTSKFVAEMNKTAAMLAKRAAADITKQDPRKPRLVAGLIGPNSNLLLGGKNRTRSVSFDDLVEAYSEQIKGLAEGGVDLLALDAVSDAVSAKAAIYAASEVYRQLKQRVPPMLIHAVVDPSTGRTPGGQGLDAFYVSVKHAKPLIVGLVASSGSDLVIGAYGALCKVSQSFTGMRFGEEGQAPTSLSSDASKTMKAGVPNLLGVSGEGLPTHVSALAQLQVSGVPRSLPEATKTMMLSGHEVHTFSTGFSLVGQRGSTRASDGFKALVDDYKAKKDPASLKKALEVCAEDAEKGADILDICVDGIANDGSNRGSKAVFRKFVEMCDADERISKAPLMLCSSEWKCLREGLTSVQGRSIVNAICLMVGEEEFLKIAKDCLKHGAAVVVMAISEEGRCVTSKDKVAALQKSYRLLRQKLDFPPEDIILDCHLQSLRPDEHPADVISAIAEVRRTCPHASVAAGVSNLSAAFGRLTKLREALHTIFLQHAIPKGLNVALADAGNLPLYGDLDKETRQRCEDVILNSGKDAAVLKSFMGFLSFRSGATVCLPLQATVPKDTSGQEAWWDLPECKAAAKEAQKEYLEKRGPLATPALQKAYFQSLKMAHVAASGKVSPEAGCARPDPCRVAGSGGTGALQQQVSTALAAGTAVGSNLLAQLNSMLAQKVLLLDGPEGPGQQLSEIKDEASFRASRFPASAKGNLNLLSITKPDAVLGAHRALLKAGADIIRTNTFYGDALCQKFYGTEAACYELNRAAAGLAKQAVAEAVSQSPQQLKFAAGVLGPSVGGISGIRAAATWDQLVQSYRPQVQGLVEGGAHLLMLDMVSDTLNAKAAVYVIEEYFSMNPKDRLPVVINVTMKEGRTASGQSLSACLASLAHAQPFAFGVTDEKVVQEAARDCSCWVHLIGDNASAGNVNLVSPSGSRPQDVQVLASKLGQAAPRKLPASQAPALKLSSLEAMTARPDDGLKLAGQRCHVQGSHRFKGLMQAYKYSKEDDVWEAAVDVAVQQVEDEADLLDVNLDLPDFDSKAAMGKFVRRCAVHPQVSKLPLIISSMSWEVIAEGLKSTQGKCIVNGISMASSEEEFVRVAAECRRFGAAIVVLAMSRADGEFPNYQEKVTSCQRAYQLLRSKLDFPPEDIIFDCLVTPLGSHGIRASPKDFIDAVAEVRRTCPGVSFIAGVSNLGVACRSAAMLREALASTFLQQAVPVGLNLALVELGRLPRVDSLEEPTRSMCIDVVTNHAVDGQHISRFLNYGAFLSGASAAEEAQKAKAKVVNTLQPKEKSALVPVKQHSRSGNRHRQRVGLPDLREQGACGSQLPQAQHGRDHQQNRAFLLNLRIHGPRRIRTRNRRQRFDGRYSFVGEASRHQSVLNHRALGCHWRNRSAKGHLRLSRRFRAVRSGTEAHRTGRYLLPREAGVLQSLDLGLRWPGLPGQHLAGLAVRPGRRRLVEPQDLPGQLSGGCELHDDPYSSAGCGGQGRRTTKFGILLPELARSLLNSACVVESARGGAETWACPSPSRRWRSSSPGPVKPARPPVPYSCSDAVLFQVGHAVFAVSHSHGSSGSQSRSNIDHPHFPCPPDAWGHPGLRASRLMAYYKRTTSSMWPGRSALR
eukprot:s3839_g7.t5